VNRLLAMLPEIERAELLSRLQRVEPPVGKVLYEFGGNPSHVYFPTTAIVSLMCHLHDGASAEFAAVGSEGMVGLALPIGSGVAPGRAVVCSQGEALRLRSHFLVQELSLSSPLPQVILRYTLALITHTAQTAICNRHHCISEQLCRWLLLTLDRLDTDEIAITHELIANLLGVRREGVTVAAGRLQGAGVIRCRRGRICVLDRSGLEQRVCECYAVVRDEYARLLSPTQTVSTPERILRLRGAANEIRDHCSSVA
jgi:CRP-like cAMP-binding protein